jgi:prevent-host-death family protein
MAQVNTVNARAQFSEIINHATFSKERVTLTRRGKEIVAVVPIEDVKLLEALEDRIDLEDARAALAEAKRKGSVSWEKVKKELAIWLLIERCLIKSGRYKVLPLHLDKPLEIPGYLSEHCGFFL